VPELRLSFSRGLDDNLRLAQEIVEAPAGDRTAAAVDEDRRFKEIGCRNAATGRRRDRSGKGWRGGFVAQEATSRAALYSREGGRMAKNPRSSAVLPRSSPPMSPVIRGLWERTGKARSNA
jgi:hypothetical protein